MARAPRGVIDVVERKISSTQIGILQVGSPESCATKMGADLCGANLRGALLEDAYLYGAVFVTHTIWPYGMAYIIPPSWRIVVAPLFSRLHRT